MGIYTLTLSPAFDMHAYCDNFIPFQENLAKITEFEAGGKGVNISRALNNYGANNTAIVVIGKDNGADFENKLISDKLKFEKISIDGRIRENITLKTPLKPETRISYTGFTATDGLIDEVEEKLLSLINENKENLSDVILTFTGRFPLGINKRKIIDFLVKFRDKGVKIVVDSRSITLDDLIEIKPFLIKPNQEEIITYTGLKINNFLDAKIAGEKLYKLGIENVIISLGGEGAVLVNGEGVFACVPPKIEVCSTVGAGDSLIAGFICGYKNGESYNNCLKLAVAFGSSKCLQNGSKPPKKDDIITMYKKIIEVENKNV